MKLFEKRVIERVVKIYQVEAVSAEDANNKDENGGSILVDSFSIDTETPVDWHETDQRTQSEYKKHL